MKTIAAMWIATLLCIIQAAALATPNIPEPPDSVKALFGIYTEGYAPAFIIERDEYAGIAYLGQSFKPFYQERVIPLSELPVSIRCCSIAPGTGATTATVLHVYIQTEAHRLVGPVDSWLVQPNGALISLTPGYIGRRVIKPE